MRCASLAIAAALFGSVGNASAGSPLYLTTSRPLANIGYTSSDAYTFIAPYFAKVKTKISVSIAKASSSTGAPSGSTPKELSSPKILLAAWDAGYATFAVNCDLTPVLNSSNSISVIGVDQSAFNGQHNVITVTPDTVVATQSAASQSGKGGVINSVNCPGAAASQSSNLSVIISVAPVPVRRAYLYLRKDAFYTDTVNVSVGSDGMLSSSDSSSQQQITNILNELAQTAAAVLGPRIAKEEEKPPAITRKLCFQDLNALVQSGPYYNEFILDKNIRKDAPPSSR